MTAADEQGIEAVSLRPLAAALEALAEEPNRGGNAAGGHEESTA